MYSTKRCNHNLVFKFPLHVLFQFQVQQQLEHTIHLEHTSTSSPATIIICKQLMYLHNIFTSIQTLCTFMKHMCSGLVHQQPSHPACMYSSVVFSRWDMMEYILRKSHPVLGFRNDLYKLHHTICQSADCFKQIYRLCRVICQLIDCFE